MHSALSIGPLHGGGLVLGYRCPSRCRHCLYACGPHRTDGGLPPGQDLDGILDQLVIKARHASYHIGGGEPFLDMDLLRRTLQGMKERRLQVDYVETNAAWVKHEKHAEETLASLARHGLRCVLVSLSPFHAEYVPLHKTLTLIKAAQRVLSQGAFIWIPDFMEDLADQPQGERLDFDQLVHSRGWAYARGLAARYSLVAAGRAGRYLHDQGQHRPWMEVARHAPCVDRLTDTTHFHVDLAGGYVPGLCAGIVLPLTELPGPVDLDRYRVLKALVEGGPVALVELARTAGFAPNATYSSPCDLCTHARCFLHAQGHPELGPAGFYDHRSIHFADTA